MAGEREARPVPSRRNMDRNDRPSGHRRGRKEPPKPKLIDTFGRRCQIPWTSEETEHAQELMEYLTVQLKEQEGTSNLPQEESHQLLSTLQQFLRQDELDRNDPLLTKIAYYFNDVKCVDLDKVGKLLKMNQQVGNSLNNKDVILLLGNTSSGKTTTLHSIAGTTFKEVVVDGFVHLKPTQFLDATVAGYETSGTRNSVTKCLQTAHLKVQDDEYVICDTPVFGQFDSLEEEIAHKHGLWDAICHAKTIRPVFVLSQECLGNRMSGLPEIFNMMTSYFDNQILLDEFETLPFQYVFTRFDDRHRTRLWKMFKYYHERANPYQGENPALFDKVVDDLIQKTCPEANVVCPISDIPRYLLRSLLKDSSLHCSPKDTLKKEGPSSAWNLLHIQLKLDLYGIMMLLATQDFEAAVEKITKFTELAQVLPTAKTFLELALKACERYAIVLWESYNTSMEKKDYITALVFVSRSLDLSEALPDMDDYIRLSYELFWQQFQRTETMPGQSLTQEFLQQLREITQLSPDMHAEVIGGIRSMRGAIVKEMSRSQEFALLLPQFKLLMNLSSVFPEANKAATEILDRLETRIMDRVKEKDFRTSTEELLVIGRMAQEFPERMRFCMHAVKLYKHALDQAIDKHFYEQAGDTMVFLSRLQAEYPDAEWYVERGLEKLWKQFSASIKQREYATAVCIVKHMSKLAHSSDTAFERSRLGIEVIRDRLFKSIESKNYGMAQVLMQQLTRLEKGLPQKPLPTKTKEVQRPLFDDSESGSGSGLAASDDAARRVKRHHQPTKERKSNPLASSPPATPLMRPTKETARARIEGTPPMKNRNHSDRDEYNSAGGEDSSFDEKRDDYNARKKTTKRRGDEEEAYGYPARHGAVDRDDYGARARDQDDYKIKSLAEEEYRARKARDEEAYRARAREEKDPRTRAIEEKGHKARGRREHRSSGRDREAERYRTRSRERDILEETRDDYHGRESSEEEYDDMSELTMSIIDYNRKHKHRHDPADLARHEHPPPPVARIGITKMPKQKRRDSPPRGDPLFESSPPRTDRYDSPQRRKSRKEPPVETRRQKQRYDPPPRKSKIRPPLPGSEGTQDPPRRSKSRPPSPPHRQRERDPPRRSKNRPPSPPPRQMDRDHHHRDPPPRRRSKSRQDSRGKHRNESPTRRRHESPVKRRSTSKGRASSPRRKSRASRKYYKNRKNVVKYDDYDAYDEYEESSKPFDESSYQERTTLPSDEEYGFSFGDDKTPRRRSDGGDYHEYKAKQRSSSLPKLHRNSDRHHRHEDEGDSQVSSVVQQENTRVLRDRMLRVADSYTSTATEDLISSWDP
ncbi:expressed unknown protein [Seminavis robusta]|uniref:G domain-containing protein n=1 Tax=Seminavis robusta TaxID=568900 RepID=A0A9N8DIL0_9STRA|nr:expressed unknown protein [Seminavis robusta]|eukprot:Sro105_g053190.1 n/a (1322) ;mRNA; f:38529-42494